MKMLTFLEDLVPYWADKIVISMCGDMDDEQLDGRKVERIGIGLVQLWVECLDYVQKESRAART